MSGYEIRLILYSNVETWREIHVPANITFKQLHGIIQKLFNFDDYHMYDFRVPEEIDNGESVNLESVIKTINYDDAESTKISEIIEDNPILLYVYDFGDNWEIIVHMSDKIDYDNKTALLTDFKGNYSPMDDMGGIFVFEEVIGSVENEDDIYDALDSYGLEKSDLTSMDFTRKYKKGSRIRID